MFEQIQIEGASFARATHYALGGGRFARVVLVPQESKPDRFVVEAQAFEIDANGVLAPGPDGVASRTPGTQHTIARAALGDTATVQPGWVRVVGDYNATNVGEDFEQVATNLVQRNATGKFYNTTTGKAYRWDIGCLEEIRQGKAQELANILSQQGNALQLLGL
jgi:hypothetical protein